jgi:hypothetical protein
MTLSGCGLLGSDSPTANDKKVLDAERRAASQSPGIPGASVSDVIPQINLKDTIQGAVDRGCNRIMVSNSLGVGDVNDALEPMREAKAIATVRQIVLANFPITDKSLEPLQGSKIHSLSLRHSNLVDPKALENIQTLGDLDVAFCPISRSGVKTLSRIPSLKWLSVDYTPLTEDDLGMLLRSAPKLKTILITGCKISKDGVDRLRRAHPNCEIRWKAERTPQQGHRFKEFERDIKEEQVSH